ncbi:hypothetical protein WN55_02773 [Dufourea novaeangliae]|uniref:Uncharacterized protein n=1 Tax=Dufourea novaeangliae TaxID=178035 RepID=A0A154NZW3_DUFNO|nr:hypothetical protein WN55_02773 [Dufourea novaeangliae]
MMVCQAIERRTESSSSLTNAEDVGRSVRCRLFTIKGTFAGSNRPGPVDTRAKTPECRKSNYAKAATMRRRRVETAFETVCSPTKPQIPARPRKLCDKSDHVEEPRGRFLRDDNSPSYLPLDRVDPFVAGDLPQNRRNAKNRGWRFTDKHDSLDGVACLLTPSTASQLLTLTIDKENSAAFTKNALASHRGC